MTDTILLPFTDMLAIEASEIQRALARLSISSAPRPVKSPDSVWKPINHVAPSLILNHLTSLVSYGCHPPSLKTTDSIVLDRPGKPSYDWCSSFQVIVCLQTFSKILESIMYSRLSCVAHVTSIHDTHQCCPLAGLSVADTSNTLTRKIRTLQMDQRNV